MGLPGFDDPGQGCKVSHIYPLNQVAVDNLYQFPHPNFRKTRWRYGNTYF